MQEMLAPTTAIKGVGLGDSLRPGHRRPLLRRLRRRLDRPRQPRGRRRRPHRPDPGRRHRRDRHPRRPPLRPPQRRRARRPPRRLDAPRPPLHQGLPRQVRQHGHQRPHRGDPQVGLMNRLSFVCELVLCRVGDAHPPFQGGGVFDNLLSFLRIATQTRDGSHATRRNLRAVPPAGTHLRHGPRAPGAYPRPHGDRSPLRGDRHQPIHPRDALLLARRADGRRRLRRPTLGPRRLPGSLGEIAASLSAVYEKLQGIEPDVCRTLRDGHGRAARTAWCINSAPPCPSRCPATAPRSSTATTWPGPSTASGRRGRPVPRPCRARPWWSSTRPPCWSSTSSPARTPMPRSGALVEQVLAGGRARRPVDRRPQLLHDAARLRRPSPGRKFPGPAAPVDALLGGGHAVGRRRPGRHRIGPRADDPVTEVRTATGR